MIGKPRHRDDRAALTAALLVAMAAPAATLLGNDHLSLALGEGP